MMANRLVVGDEGATFGQVMMTIDNSPVVEVLYSHWTHLAMELDIPQFEIQKMRQSLLTGMQTNIDVIHDIIMSWRSRYASEATIQRLIDSFRKIEMNYIADQLMTKFVSEYPDIQVYEHESVAVRPQNESKRDKIHKDPDTSGYVEAPPIALNVDTANRDVLRKSQSLDLVVQHVENTDIYYYPLIKLGHGLTSIVFHGYFGNKELQAAVKEVQKQHNDVYARELSIFMSFLNNQLTHHPNVVRLFQWTDNVDVLYFAMEKATCDLKKFLLIYPNLERRTTLKISHDTVKGLQFLHENHILHRDIKPENILLFGKDEEFLAKLGDFGVSRKMKSLESTMSKSAGTETWMSPEAITAMHNEEPFPNSKALDIFSLGMTMFYTFSRGIHPFARSKLYGSFPLMNIKDHNILPGELMEVKDCESISQLICWMMKKTPGDRPDMDQIISHPIWTN